MPFPASGKGISRIDIFAGMEYRRKQLRNLAYRLGFEFSEEDHWGLESHLTDFRLTSRGRRRRISNILRKQDGLMEYNLQIFDYRYLRWNGQNNRPVHQTVFYVESQRLGLPELWMQPETLAHKLGELLGFGDIDFVRFPKFSGQYRLTGEDEEFIRHHFTDDVLNYFTLNKGWSLEGIGYYLLVYKKGILLPPNEIEQLFVRGTEIYNLFSRGT